MARKRYSDEDILKLLHAIELHQAVGSDLTTAYRAASFAEANRTYSEYRGQQITALGGSCHEPWPAASVTVQYCDVRTVNCRSLASIGQPPITVTLMLRRDQQWKTSKTFLEMREHVSSSCSFDCIG